MKSSREEIPFYEVRISLLLTISCGCCWWKAAASRTESSQEPKQTLLLTWPSHTRIARLEAKSHHQHGLVSQTGRKPAHQRDHCPSTEEDHREKHAPDEKGSMKRTDQPARDKNNGYP